MVVQVLQKETLIKESTLKFILYFNWLFWLPWPYPKDLSS